MLTHRFLNLFQTRLARLLDVNIWEQATSAITHIPQVNIRRGKNSDNNTLWMLSADWPVFSSSVALRSAEWHGLSSTLAWCLKGWLEGGALCNPVPSRFPGLASMRPLQFRIPGHRNYQLISVCFVLGILSLFWRCSLFSTHYSVSSINYVNKPYKSQIFHQCVF